MTHSKFEWCYLQAYVTHLWRPTQRVYHITLNGYLLCMYLYILVHSTFIQDECIYALKRLRVHMPFLIEHIGGLRLETNNKQPDQLSTIISPASIN